MEEYSLSIKPSAVKELERIPLKADRQRIAEAILALAKVPRPNNSQKLTAQDAYRIRRGPYRVIYLIDDGTHTVVVIKIGHRREVYR